MTVVMTPRAEVKVMLYYIPCSPHLRLSKDHPQRTPKKLDKDDDSLSNNKRDDSPAQKKSGLQLRSEYLHLC